jgi:hypothetical protein
MLTTMEQITSIEADRQALLNSTDSDLATFHNETRLTRLRDMKVALDRLWDQERQNRAMQTKARIEQAQRQQRRSS